MSQRAKVLVVILIGGLFLAVVFGGLLAYSLYYTGPTVAEESVLEIRLSGPLAESVQPDQTLRLFAKLPNSLRNLTQSVKKAKDDKNIKGILVFIEDIELGFGKVEELRNSLIEFKKSGKPIYVYMERGEDRSYYFATVADKIYVSPVGDLNVKGLAASASFYKGLFNKLKVEPNFERHGKYKSFADSYTREDMSAEHREELEAILDGLYNDYVAAVATARKKTPEEVKQLIDEGPYNNARKAVEVGLIDEALYFDEVKDRIKQDLKLSKYEAININKYSESLLPKYSDDKIAVIYATGAVVSGRSNFDPFFGQTLGSDTVAGAIRKAREDSEIKAIVLRVDSPGGSALASDIIWREVNLAKKEKPFVASMSDVAASGGYYISMAADKIVAQPGTITGSIGVVTGKLNISGLYKEHLGINVETVKRGQRADYYSEFRNFTEEERTKFHNDMMEFYREFVSKAAQGRSMKIEDMDKVAQGRVWTGTQAKEQGLIDELGGLDKAIEVAKQLAKIPAERDVQIVEYPKAPGLLQALMGIEQEGEEDSEVRFTLKEQSERAAMEKLLDQSLPPQVRDAVRTMSLLKRIENERIFAIMPYQLRIE